jgi:hypothetical protein
VSAQYKIGIDGGTKTGFAVWDSEKKQFATIKTIDFWEAYEWVCNAYSTEQCVVYVEDPAQNKRVWKRPGMKDHEYSQKCQNVGMVKKESELMIRGLHRHGFTVIAIRPQKGSYTKMSAEAFKNITKYTGRTSEHARDAAMLVFQR